MFLRYAKWTLAISILFSIIGGYYTTKLYGNLKTELDELLPRTSRSVQDLNEVTRRLQSIDNLAILVFSKHTHESKKFIVDLAHHLEQFPKNEIAGIEYRIDRELEFFRKRQALYMDLHDLEKVRNFIRDRIQYEMELYNPLNIFSGVEIPVAELDFRALQQKYERRAQTYAHFPQGFFATEDETKRVLLIDVAGKTLGIGGVKHLKNKVNQVINQMNPLSYAPDMEIHYTGSVEETLEEQEALVEDLLLSTVVVIALVSVAMLAFFQTLWPTVALVLTLFAATLWTFGLSYFVVGYLNANSAFLGSIVLGNGLNFGTIFLARYLEERRYPKNSTHLRASVIASKETWKATLTAALAAGLSYGSLTLTSFRGFNQFGVIGLMGMTLCWLASYTLLPVLLGIIERMSLMRNASKHAFHTKKSRRGAWFTAALAYLVSHWPRSIVFVSTVLTALSLFMLTKAGPHLLETNLDHLRSKRSNVDGAGFYSQYLNEIFQRFLTPLVVLPTTQENAVVIAKKLKELKAKEGRESAIVSVQTIQDFLPTQQTEKIKVLHEIKSLLSPRILSKLSRTDHKKVGIFLSPEAFVPVQMSELPPLIRSKFMEKDGSFGKLVLVEPPLSKDIWKGENLEHFIGELRDTADSVEPGTPIAGGMAITADLVASITKDGPLATLLAFCAAVLLVIILFREPKTILLALFSLLVGVAWFGGLIVKLEEYGLKINFLNFVALPITFGIGVDYGINIFQSYRVRRKGHHIIHNSDLGARHLTHRTDGIIQVIRETGGAVGLCSLTTIIGYSSLLMASNQGFISFGLLAVLGEITCVIAALIALPALLARRK